MSHLGPVGPRWAPCWPLEPCHQGSLILIRDSHTVITVSADAVVLSAALSSPWTAQITKLDIVCICICLYGLHYVSLMIKLYSDLLPKYRWESRHSRVNRSFRLNIATHPQAICFFSVCHWYLIFVLTPTYFSVDHTKLSYLSANILWSMFIIPLCKGRRCYDWPSFKCLLVTFKGWNKTEITY